MHHFCMLKAFITIRYIGELVSYKRLLFIESFALENNF